MSSLLVLCFLGLKYLLLSNNVEAAAIDTCPLEKAWFLGRRYISLLLDTKIGTAYLLLCCTTTVLHRQYDLPITKYWMYVPQQVIVGACPESLGRS